MKEKERARFGDGIQDLDFSESLLSEEWCIRIEEERVMNLQTAAAWAEYEKLLLEHKSLQQTVALLHDRLVALESQPMSQVNV